MNISTDVLLFTAALIVSIATWYIKQVDNRLRAAFKRIDKMRIYLFKNTAYTEETDDI